MELVGSEYNPRAAEQKEQEEEAAKPKAKGVGERIKAAAQRMRSKKNEESPGREKGKGQAKGQTRGAARKSTAPRKQGGS